MTAYQVSNSFTGFQKITKSGSYRNLKKLVRDSKASDCKSHTMIHLVEDGKCVGLVDLDDYNKTVRIERM